MEAVVTYESFRKAIRLISRDVISYRTLMQWQNKLNHLQIRLVASFGIAWRLLLSQ